MPNFNRLAMASLTPGGAQAGVNDIVSAILGADAAKAKAAQEAQVQAQAQANEQARLGETIRSNMAGENIKRADMSSDGQYRDKALGETIRHNMADEALGGKNYHGDPMMSEERAQHMDWENANIDSGLDPSGQAWVDQTSYDPLDIAHERPINKKVKGPPSPEIEGKRLEAYKAMRAKRAAGSVTDSLVPPKTATAPVSAGAPTTPAPLGPPASAAVRKPVGANPADVAGEALDYAVRDAKFQKLSPTYRQKRSDPSFDWKKFLDAKTPR